MVDKLSLLNPLFSSSDISFCGGDGSIGCGVEVRDLLNLPLLLPCPRPFDFLMISFGFLLLYCFVFTMVVVVVVTVTIDSGDSTSRLKVLIYNSI
jgi:hypothetical protein